ncbi:J domain-containing protein [Lysobacter sp. GCM10012299]|uniref:J domain-containing protein n=1 Tax=Lysobacter sp. GCM10012299 TaxID=3317333 RepID=UPI00361D0279
MDFSLLYFQLGLEPGCSLEELKRAYRVRVAELHPDRHGTGAVANEGLEQLTELTALYSKAIRFHRIHGRLPGAAPKAGGDHASHSVHPLHSASAHQAGRGSHDATPASPRVTASRPVARSEPAPNRTTPTLAIVTILVLVIVMLALHWSESGVEQKMENSLHAQEAEHAYDSQEPRLELGMEEGAVFAIQGAPVVVQDGVWNYGSSWVRFEDGHLVDWSSVPPNRLRTATPRPVSEEATEEESQ